MEQQNKQPETQRRCTSALTRLLGTRQSKYRLWDSENLEYFENWHELISLARTMQDKFDNDEFIVTEFTGIQDCCCEDVYEGDIVKVGDIAPETYHVDPWALTHLVVWGGKDYPAFTLKPGLETTENVFSYLKLATDSYEDFWIVGNIFENPELLDECT